MRAHARSVRPFAALVAVAGAVVLAGAGAAVGADTPPTPTAPGPPAALVVALRLGDTGLQAGVLRGREVVLARGFEVEVARLLARRLRSRVDRFVELGPPARLLAGGSPQWHLAIASLEPSPAARSAAALSDPYLTTDQAVVLRRGLPRPAGLADLRSRLLCAARGSGGLEAIARSIRPSRAPLVVPGRDRLRSLLRAGACDAAVLPAHEAGRLVAGQRRLLGPVTGRIEHGRGLVIAVARGTGIDVASVNRELGRMRADGALGRLARSWLGLDPAGLRQLR